jgi:hypothetical protein
MRFHRLLCIVAAVTAGSLMARADIVPGDPEIALDADRFSEAIGLGVTFSPNTTGGGVTGFYNPFSEPIVELQFEATALTGLSPSIFTCVTTAFLLDCSINYNSSTGSLTITFSGTVPPGAPPSPFDGIPPLPPGCTPDSTNPACDETGHFAINLNNNNSPTSGVGGWDAVAPPTGLVFDTTQIVLDTPEPSFTLLLALGCALIFALSRRFKPTSPPPLRRSGIR